MENKTYLQVYGCKHCPVAKYCGTMIQSTRLCNSYESSDNFNQEEIDNIIAELLKP